MVSVGEQSGAVAEVVAGGKRLAAASCACHDSSALRVSATVDQAIGVASRQKGGRDTAWGTGGYGHLAHTR